MVENGRSTEEKRISEEAKLSGQWAPSQPFFTIANHAIAAIQP
jgi:hypothetical protein